MVTTLQLILRKVPLAAMAGMSTWALAEMGTLANLLPIAIDGYNTAMMIGALTSFFTAAHKVITELEAIEAQANAPVPVTEAPDATVVAPAPSPAAAPKIPTFVVGGVVVNSDLDGPLGQVDRLSCGTFTIGMPISVAIVTGNGTKVPVGAYYIGRGSFMYNGSYYY